MILSTKNTHKPNRIPKDQLQSWRLCDSSRHTCVWLRGEGGVWDLRSSLQGSLKDLFAAASCLVGVVGWLWLALPA